MGALQGFEGLKLLPDNGVPLARSPEPDQAWAGVARRIHLVVARIQAGEGLISMGRPRRSFVSETSAR